MKAMFSTIGKGPSEMSQLCHDKDQQFIPDRQVEWSIYTVHFPNRAIYSRGLDQLQLSLREAKIIKISPLTNK